MNVLGASAPLVVVMGVSGCGKSTVGAALADRLGIPFRDADDLHPAANVEKMSSGTALTDDDRAPWLELVGAELARHRVTGLVIACSALKVAYRDVLRRHAPGVFLVHLEVSAQVLGARMAVRSEHFMPLALLDSQLAALEPLQGTENGVTVNAGQSIERILARVEPDVRAAAELRRTLQG